MIIHSDWHIHSEASYDSYLTLEEINLESKKRGFCKMGITDHANFNDTQFISDIKKSSEIVKEFQKEHPHFVLGVELTPIEKSHFDYIAKTGSREGFTPSKATSGIELAFTKDELVSLGVKYGIGAAHWRLDFIADTKSPTYIEDSIKEWYRQQMWLVNDERVTILGHPWYSGESLWYEDFSKIPHSMNMDIASVLKEKNKYVECNAHFFCTPATTEKFRHQYAEYLREMHEMGIPITYGSDAHTTYVDHSLTVEKYLLSAGFKDGDIVELDEKVFW